MNSKSRNSRERSIPKPSILRLCKVYDILNVLSIGPISTVSSKELGLRLGVASHNIRKDISFVLGESGTIGSGYEIDKLKSQIEMKFGFTRKRKACIIGLDSMGTALLNKRLLLDDNFKIMAGFDSNINRLETLKTEIPLYPTHEITEVVRSHFIEFAVITDAGKDPVKLVERLVAGGIKGIVNFSSVILTSGTKEIFISNFDLIGEFRYLVALMTLHALQKEA